MYKALLIIFIILFVRQFIIVLASRFIFFDIVNILSTFLFEKSLDLFKMPRSIARHQKLLEMKERLLKYINDYNKKRKEKEFERAQSKQSKFQKRLDEIYLNNPAYIKQRLRNQIESKIMEVILNVNLDTLEQKEKVASIMAELKDRKDIEAVNFNVYWNSIEKVIDNIRIPKEIKEKAKEDREKSIQLHEDEMIKEFPIYEIKNYFKDFSRMTRYNQLLMIIDEMENDFHKFYNKDVKIAGTRIRKAMQELKKLSEEIKKETQNNTK